MRVFMFYNYSLVSSLVKFCALIELPLMNALINLIADGATFSKTHRDHVF